MKSEEQIRHEMFSIIRTTAVKAQRICFREYIAYLDKDEIKIAYTYFDELVKKNLVVITDTPYVGVFLTIRGELILESIIIQEIRENPESYTF